MLRSGMVTVAPADRLKDVAVDTDLLQQHRASQSTRQFCGFQRLDHREPVRPVGQGLGTAADALDKVPVLHGKRLVRGDEWNHYVAIPIRRRWLSEVAPIRRQAHTLV